MGLYLARKAKTCVEAFSYRIDKSSFKSWPPEEGLGQINGRMFTYEYIVKNGKDIYLKNQLARKYSTCIEIARKYLTCIETPSEDGESKLFKRGVECRYSVVLKSMYSKDIIKLSWSVIAIVTQVNDVVLTYRICHFRL